MHNASASSSSEHDLLQTMACMAQHFKLNRLCSICMLKRRASRAAGHHAQAARLLAQAPAAGSQAQAVAIADASAAGVGTAQIVALYGGATACIIMMYVTGQVAAISLQCK
jgi:hypothetical protein